MSSKPPSNAAGEPAPNGYAGAHVDPAAQIPKHAASLQAAPDEGAAWFVPVGRDFRLIEDWYDDGSERP